MPVYKVTVGRSVVTSEEASFLVCAKNEDEANYAAACVVRRQSADYYVEGGWVIVPGSERTVGFYLSGVVPCGECDDGLERPIVERFG